jgi:hypothetical protein
MEPFPPPDIFSKTPVLPLKLRALSRFMPALQKYQLS